MISIIATGQFSVKESVWLGAAILSIGRSIDQDIDLEKLYFTQSQIQDLADQLAISQVQNARISQHYNGDHPKSTTNYLRENSLKNRRLSHPLEFNGDKVQPFFEVEI